MKRYLYIIIGSISLVLGAVGIFVPLLPTTPFWLLTAWLYFRSSPTLYAKAMNNKVFGNVVTSFTIHRAIPLRGKIFSVSLLWATILFSAFYVVQVWWLRGVLFTIAILVTWHILSYKTLKKEDETVCECQKQEYEEDPDSIEPLNN